MIEMLIKFILRAICFFIVFWVGYKAGKAPKTSFWRQMEFWPGGGTWRCNHCGRQVMFMSSTPEEEHLYYCPECGDKMSRGK